MHSAAISHSTSFLSTKCWSALIVGCVHVRLLHSSCLFFLSLSSHCCLQQQRPNFPTGINKLSSVLWKLMDFWFNSVIFSESAAGLLCFFFLVKCLAVLATMTLVFTVWQNQLKSRWMPCCHRRKFFCDYLEALWGQFLCPTHLKVIFFLQFSNFLSITFSSGSRLFKLLPEILFADGSVLGKTDRRSSRMKTL